VSYGGELGGGGGGGWCTQPSDELDTWGISYNWRYETEAIRNHYFQVEVASVREEGEASSFAVLKL